MKRTLMFLLCLAFTFFGGALAVAADEISETGYVSTRDTSLRTLEEGREAALLNLPAGQELVVIERKIDEREGALVHVGLEVNEESGLPTDVWVREMDLSTDDWEIRSFSQEELIEILKKMTYCYRHVKLYLLKIGKVKSYLPGASAYMAASILPKHGFRRSGHSPASAQNGEVCVYSGGPAGHGHIEVKRNGKWWYGYGFINHPIRNRKFIACFVK